VLGIGVFPITWPIFRSGVFRGVYQRIARRIYLFDEQHAGSSATKGAERPPVLVTGIEDSKLRDELDEAGYDKLCEDIELLAAAGDEFDRERFVAGNLSPLFFGSAINNFGLEAFLDTFGELMPPPGPRMSDRGPIAPAQDEFSAFVFKIQANMDRAHRDSVAFLRICSGRFERGMKVHHVRTGRDLRLANPTQFLAQERNLVEEAFAGDVIGVYDPGVLEIGVTLTGGSALVFEGIASIAPEHFARIAMVDPLRRKQFKSGIQKLAQEGTIQLYQPPEGRVGDLILGAVGELQLEVVKHRLRAEYAVEVRLEPVSYRFARWASLAAGEPIDMEALRSARVGMVVRDIRERPVVLFEGEWALRSAEKFHPELVFAETAHGVVMRDR
jgi:peptide chain release factor 3